MSFEISFHSGQNGRCCFTKLHRSQGCLPGRPEHNKIRASLQEKAASQIASSKQQILTHKRNLCHSPREEILALSLRPGKAATEQNPTPNFQMRKFADFGMPTRNQTWHPFTYHSTEQEMIGVLSAACCNFTQLCTYPPCKQLLTTWQMQLQAY